MESRTEPFIFSEPIWRFAKGAIYSFLVMSSSALLTNEWSHMMQTDINVL